MNKSILWVLWVLLLAVGLQTSWAFSLDGPVGNGGDSWQVQNIGYGPPSDDVAPKNLGEEYRRNLPVMYYTYDANFFDYFGTDGAASVDAAFAMLNALTNVDQYSQQLSEFPLGTRQVNYQAQALGLFDMKSFTLSIMMEQMGLANPIQYAWTLHNRYLPNGATCPQGEEYSVAQRNFDYFSSPLNQLQYSPYINNVLYSYLIEEVCQDSPVLAWTEPYSVDPDPHLAGAFAPVASDAIAWGDYYTGLTRDDVAGLRYLLSTNNVNMESAPAGSVLGLITTNTAIPQSFPPYSPTNSTGTNAIGFYYFTGDTNGGYGYGDLGSFLSFISTNDQAAVQAAYPGVVVASVTATNRLATNETYSYSYEVSPKSPYGADPVLTVTTNYYLYYRPYYTYQFANIFTNHIYTNTAQLVKATVGPKIGQPYGSPIVTNTTRISTNLLGGDFFVFPPFQGSFCPLDIIGSISNVTVYTNYLTLTDTNVPVSTNGIDTNLVGYSSSTYLVSYFTNYTFNVNPVSCTEATNSTSLYQGIGNVKFVRADYDSLIGQYFQPITNYYSMVAIANSQAVRRNFERVVTEPDFLFSAQDLTPGPNSLIFQTTYQSTVPPFDTGNVLPGLAGPGTITPNTTISFNKNGPLYYNTPAYGMNGDPYFNQNPGNSTNYYGFYFIWASFDGTTNAPIVFPNGTSIGNLENQVLIKLSPASIDGWGTGFNESVTFTTTGGSFTQPYAWSAVNLPPGLSLSSSGTLSGVPTQAGTFDFTLTLTDYVGRSVQWVYTITIQ